MIVKGNTVLVKTEKGAMVTATLLDAFDDDLWWVQYELDGQPEITIYNVNDIMRWNTKPSPCVCGRLKANSPNHAVWCDYGIS